jgi:hypothetical protein
VSFLSPSSASAIGAGGTKSELSMDPTLVLPCVCLFVSSFFSSPLPTLTVKYLLFLHDFSVTHASYRSIPVSPAFVNHTRGGTGGNTYRRLRDPIIRVVLRDKRDLSVRHARAYDTYLG